MARPLGIPAHNVKSEIGNKYGRLIVIARDAPDKYGRAVWKCKCDCGKEVSKPGFKLRGNQVRSCGCYRDELISNLKRLSPEERERRLTQPRQCGRCKRVLSPEMFGNKVLRTQCKDCRSEIQQEWRVRDENGTRSNWKKKYGITEEGYYFRLHQQSNKCAICLEEKPKNMKYFFVDHDHNPELTGKIECVRGLLCVACNTLVRSHEDHIDLLKSAIRYLEKYYSKLEQIA
jgi:recombination endonuclease VII